MKITPTSAELQVAGGLLCLRRPGPGYLWEISLFEYARFTGSPFTGGMYLQTAELSAEHYAGRSFAEPADAAAFIGRLIAA